MKTRVRWLLIIAFAGFSLLLLFYFTRGPNEKSVSPSLSMPQSQAINKTTPGSPVRLIIPTINVNAAVQYVGITARGAMEVPNNAIDVGWFKIGPRPGEKGSAVIAGHFDGQHGEPGVFTNLYQLKTGDKVYIQDDKGYISFVVREGRLYDSGYADEVFSSSDSTHLNLITCDGVWDGIKKSYSKRLVVFADAVD